MSTRSQDWRSSNSEDQVLNSESLLQELGWVQRPLNGGAGAAAVGMDQYCSYCWCLIPAGAQRCGDCGQSVEEMEAERRARAEADRQWRPSRSRSGTAAMRTRTSSVSSRAGERPVVAPPRPEQRWKQIALAVAVGTLSGAAAATGVWLLLLPAPQRTPALTTPAGNRPASVAAATPAAAHIAWRTADSDLQMELQTPTGVVVASSSNAAATSAVPPGEYRLHIRNEDGRWTAPDQTVVAIGGETLTLGLSGELLGKYHLWAGKQAYDKDEKKRAEREWRAAIEADANCGEARLQLAALLAVRSQYKEARRQVQEVLDRQPGNEQATRLMQVLGQLGN